MGRFLIEMILLPDFNNCELVGYKLYSYNLLQMFRNWTWSRENNAFVLRAESICGL